MDVDEDFEMGSASSDHRMCPPTTPRGRAGMRGAAAAVAARGRPSYGTSPTASFGRGSGGDGPPRFGGRGGRGGGGGRGRAKLSPGYTANDRLKSRKESCGFMRTSDLVDKDGNPVAAPPPRPRVDVNANVNPYKIDRRQPKPSPPKPQTELPQQSIAPSLHQGSDGKCICLRPLKRVTCSVCGYYLEGRLLRFCESHPQVCYLLDINCCPNPECNSPPRFLKELEFPVGYVPVKENIRTM